MVSYRPVIQKLALLTLDRKVQVKTMTGVAEFFPLESEFLPLCRGDIKKTNQLSEGKSDSLDMPEKIHSQWVKY